MPKLKINLDIWPDQDQSAHGEHDKIGIVLHETVSPQIMNSISDVKGVSEYVGRVGYGIHGITDNDGNIAWCKGHGKAVLYHTSSSGTIHKGSANSNFIGIEQISDVMVKYKTQAARTKAWLGMDKELNATAKLIACIVRAHKMTFDDNPGNTMKHGITTHYEVTYFNGVGGGHVDCHPTHLGGYYPKRLVIRLAKRYYKLGWHF